MNTEDRMASQSAEFNALQNLMRKAKGLFETAVVDDDYPQMRHYYEGALQEFIKALQGNNRLPVNTLNFRQLRETNESRVKRWHKGGIKEWSISEWAVAMMGEAGEICDAIKKLNRIETGAQNLSDIDTKEKALDAIGEELADTILYADLLAQACNINLEFAIMRKFNSVSEKYGFPERL